MSELLCTCQLALQVLSLMAQVWVSLVFQTNQALLLLAKTLAVQIRPSLEALGKVLGVKCTSLFLTLLSQARHPAEAQVIKLLTLAARSLGALSQGYFVYSILIFQLLLML